MDAGDPTQQETAHSTLEVAELHGESRHLQREAESMTAIVWRRFRRHPAAIISSGILLALFLGVILVSFSPYDPETSDLSVRLQPPSLQHPMGTDQLGRDMLTRVLYGGRVSILVAFMVVVITLVVGIPVGAASGYFGGAIDNILMRITDVALTLPTLLVLILLSAIMREVDLPIFKRNSVMTIALVIGLLSWMTAARLLRAEYLSIRELEFIEAAHAMGASNLRVITRHILPNAISPIIVQSTLMLGFAIMIESGLSFLGFGIQPPTPSWGNLLSNAQQHMTQHPWLAIFPGLMIFLTVISINYIGDALRDAIDPYKVF
ncbi:MAG TPA: ABC transporter permease [candidate division Zixibacteria bacterium]|jgi:peptide/nickel transport system permease protein|nr:ABC transporter permease [candidate division Zixibacteria bacterium]